MNRLYFADERRFICQRKAIHPHMKRLSFFVHDSLWVVLKLCRVDFRSLAVAEGTSVDFVFLLLTRHSMQASSALVSFVGSENPKQV